MQVMRKRYPRNENGQALIFITVAFAVLGMFIGLAVDGGRAYLMHDRLKKIVDAASLAGAKALALESDLAAARDKAAEAACDSTKVNGLSSGECGPSGSKVQIAIDYIPNPNDPKEEPQLGVIATGTDRARTFFMALGTLLGCTTCKTIDVGAIGKAVPDTLADIVLVLDDTGTMNHNCNAAQDNANCPIKGARDGANALVTLLFADPNSHAKIAFVPFRGCFADDENLPIDPAGAETLKPGIGCIRFSHLLDLTNNADLLTTAINARRAPGGYPGTNVCAAMHEGRKKLLGGRAIARKIMVLLTDGDQKYSDYSGGGDIPKGKPNLGNPAPFPYPTQRYDAANGGDKGSDTNPGSCRHNPSGGLVQYGDEHDTAIRNLDQKALQKAQSLKDPNTDKIEIYVLRFEDDGGTPDDSLSSGTPPGSCDPALVTTSLPGRVNANDMLDRNLSRCLASNTAMGDPFAKRANDHYFFAATPADIPLQFAAIAADILRKRRLVG